MSNFNLISYHIHRDGTCLLESRVRDSESQYLSLSFLKGGVHYILFFTFQLSKDMEMRPLPSFFFFFFFLITLPTHDRSWPLLVRLVGPLKVSFVSPTRVVYFMKCQPGGHQHVWAGTLQRVIHIYSFFHWETLNPTSAGWQVASASVFKDPDLFRLIDIGRWCSWKVAGDRIPPGGNEDTRDFQIKI